MSRHRFINDGRSPIPMGSAAEYTCVCGKRGTYAAIERHIAEMRDAIPDASFGGNTEAYYVPMEPREPAPATFNESEEPSAPGLPPPPPPRFIDGTCPICGIGGELADLPEITAWSCGHWLRKRARSIAESFQEMLRTAYQAGEKAATSGETFETWYQREVLQ